MSLYDKLEALGIEFEGAPRANPNGASLYLPWILRDRKTRKILLRGESRDDLEEKARGWLKRSETRLQIAELRGLYHEAAQVPGLLAKNRELQNLLSKVYWLLRDGVKAESVIQTIEAYDSGLRRQS